MKMQRNKNNKKGSKKARRGRVVSRSLSSVNVSKSRKQFNAGGTQVSVVAPSVLRSGTGIDFATAPYSSIVGRAGLRAHIRCLLGQLYKTTSYTYQTWYDGTYSYYAYSSSPYYVNGSYYMPLFGTTTSMPAVFCNMFERYAIRQCDIHYVPSGGMSIAGNAAIVSRFDVNTSFMASNAYSLISQSENSKVFRINNPMTYRVLVEKDLSKAATNLFYTGASADVADVSQFRVYCATDSKASSSAINLGDLWAEVTIDLYGMQSGTVAPTMLPPPIERKDNKDKSCKDSKESVDSKDVKVRDVLNEKSSRLRELQDELAAIKKIDEDYVKVSTSSSTSSLSSTTTNSKNLRS